MSLHWYFCCQAFRASQQLNSSVAVVVAVGADGGLAAEVVMVVVTMEGEAISEIAVVKAISEIAVVKAISEEAAATEVKLEVTTAAAKPRVTSEINVTITTERSVEVITAAHWHLC